MEADGRSSSSKRSHGGTADAQKQRSADGTLPDTSCPMLVFVHRHFGPNFTKVLGSSTEFGKLHGLLQAGSVDCTGNDET